MTVSEIMERFWRYPADMRVVVNGYEEGYDDLSPEQLSVVKIHLHAGVHEWQSRHGDPRDWPKRLSDHAGAVDALVLHRVSH